MMMGLEQTRVSIWLSLIAGCFLIHGAMSIDYNQPISPEDYQSMCGQGFSVFFFSTVPPLKKYKDQNIDDVHNAGFTNLRLRCGAKYYPYPYTTENFTYFLDSLDHVVDKCLDTGVWPIISWAHGHAEAYATDDDRTNFTLWWSEVAKKLKYKDYRVSFNIYTELGIDDCSNSATRDCSESLKMNTPKYNTWTREGIKAIRDTGGNNEKRIIIIGSHKKTAKGLSSIDQDIIDNNTHLMVEHHVYASGPNKKNSSVKYWVGNGTAEQRQTLIDELELAKNSTKLLNYFGAWMPLDNKAGELSQEEIENFAQFFVSTLKRYKVPWSLNVLDVYYDTKKMYWITENETRFEKEVNASRILDVIKKFM